MKKIFSTLLLLPILAGAEAVKPNVLILFLDDVSAQDFGCYGVRDPKVANTPHVDRLAERGAVFLNCWGAPICGPSRAMMMTGRYASKTGWWDNKMKPEGAEKGGNFALDNQVANKIFHDNGYATAFLGKWQLGGRTSDPCYGIDYGLTSGWGVGKNPYPHRVWPKQSPMPGATSWEFQPSMYQWDAESTEKGYVPVNEDDYAADLEMDAVKRFIQKQVQRDKPFFVYWPTHVGHGAWDFDRNLPGGWSHTAVPARDRNGKQLYNADGSKKLSVPTYKAHVEYADYMLGEVLRFLDEEKIADNTIVVFAADNGAQYFGKGTVYQQRGTHVPLVVKAPGMSVRGQVQALVSLADITPTLVDLADLDFSKNYAFDGRSLKPVLSGEKDEVRDTLISYFNVLRMARDGRYVLDGCGTLWDTHDSPNCADFSDVSNNPEFKALKAKLSVVAETSLPLPPPESAYYKRFLAIKEQRYAGMKKTTAARLSGRYNRKYDLPREK